jgi:malonyl-CoA O-methyltransferase
MEPGEAYRLWAPTYSEETAISVLDEQLAARLSPSLEGKRLLDAGCGTGRRFLKSDARFAVGVDLSTEMLSAGAMRRVAVADVRTLPFAAVSFDMIWCRLVLGHLADPTPAYHELARVCRTGGKLLVSDFHAAAVAAGHQRSFRDASGRLRAAQHHLHDADTHTRMAKNAGLKLSAQEDGVIGPNVEGFYARAGRLPAYERDRGLPVVAAFLFERMS